VELPLAKNGMMTIPDEKNLLGMAQISGFLSAS
jgi:hypothetical protein